MLVNMRLLAYEDEAVLTGRAQVVNDHLDHWYAVDEDQRFGGGQLYQDS